VDVLARRTQSYLIQEVKRVVQRTLRLARRVQRLAADPDVGQCPDVELDNEWLPQPFHCEEDRCCRRSDSQSQRAEVKQWLAGLPEANSSVNPAA